MERFTVTLPELQLICTASLRRLLGRNFGVVISQLPAINGSNWEVTAIDPLPSRSALTAAMQTIADLQQCFTLTGNRQR